MSSDRESGARRKVRGEAVKHELLPGQSPALLQELKLLTRAGDLNADSLRKLKQVNHLVQLLAPALEDVFGRFGEPLLVDCGAGKSYLGFVLYELFLRGTDKGRLVSIESRADLVQASRERASRLGYDRISFLASSIGGAEVPARINLVTALHACDTATDDALALAIRHNADHVAVVPCCQAEVAQQLKRAAPDATPGAPLVATLYEHPWHRREFGSHLTNVVRALTLEAHGYAVTVTELTGWEHSLKNELILGRKVRGGSREAEQKLAALLAATGVRPKLTRLLAKEEQGGPEAPQGSAAPH